MKTKDLLTTILLHIMWIFPIDSKKVIFKSFRGQNSGDNPGAIYRELIKRRPDLKYIWVMRDPSISIPGATVIKNGSIKELFHLATAKVWIDNKRKGMWCSKRKKQYYIQTWHGGISGKKVELEAKGALSDYYLKNAAKDSHNADLFLSDSRWTSDLYKRAFFYDGEILECGLPRSDVLFKDLISTKNRVYEHFGLDSDIKLLLYAPTFRVNGSLEPYNLDYGRLVESLECAYGGKWRVLVRLHPNIASKCNELFLDSQYVINASLYNDINELIVASDLLITDYSSCMFDAMEAGKIVYLYATDIEEYDKDRGRYFEFSELPFPLATNNDELSTIIMTGNTKLYYEQVNVFSKTLGLFDGGHACEEVCNKLEKIL